MNIRRLIWLSMGLYWAATSAADTLFKDPFEILQPVTLRVEITPGAKLLTAGGQTDFLSAQVLDNADKAVDLPITWRSSNDAMVSVDAGGGIEAIGSLGSAQIIAEAQGALSDVILVTVADPVDGARLIDDAQIVQPPTPVDPEAAYGIGYEYIVSLNNIVQPAVNDILVGSGEIPLAGRVIEASSRATEVTVKLAVVRIDELFDEIVIDENIRLDDVPIETLPELAEVFDVTRLSDGSLRLTPLPTAAKGAQGTSISQFLDCESELTNWQNIFTINLADELILDPSISLDIQYDSAAGGLQRLVALGSLNVVYEFKARTKAAFEGKATCKFQVGKIPIPVGGWLSFIFSGQIPLGAGIEISGKVSTTEEAGMDLTVVGNANFTAGVECATQCDLVASLDAGVNSDARLIEPSLDVFLSNLQLDLGVHAFAYADLKFGNPVIKALQFSAFKVKAGPKLSGTFRSLTAQVADTDYGSEFKLELTGSAGLASDIQTFLAQLSVVLPAVQLFSIKYPLSESPKGTLSISPATVAPGSEVQLGEQATFTVDLSKSTFLGFYNVEEVRIYWEKTDSAGDTILELNRPGCNTFSPSEGQIQFSCQTDYLEAHLGQQNFHLFVRGSMFGLPVPFWLEAGKSTLASLLVGQTGFEYNGGTTALVSGEEYLRQDTHWGEQEGDEIFSYVEIPGEGSARATGIANIGQGVLRAIAEGNPETINDSGVIRFAAQTLGRSTISFFASPGLTNTGSEPITKSVTFTLSGTLDMTPVEGDVTEATLSVLAEMEDGVELEGVVELCEPSLDGKLTCGNLDSSGVLEGYQGGPISFTLGPQTIQPGETMGVYGGITVSIRGKGEVDYTLTATEIN